MTQRPEDPGNISDQCKRHYWSSLDRSMVCQMGEPRVEILYLLCQMGKGKGVTGGKEVGTYRGNKGSFVVRPMKVCRG